MIILPDRNKCHTKFLMPVPKKEWMIPSLVQPKDQMGNQNRTFFRIQAKTNDGKVCWRGFFEDRDDFDAVLYAIAKGTLKYQKELWTLSTPHWEQWLGELITYDFAVYNVLTTPVTQNIGFYKPRDWNDTSNSVECIGGGASGGIASTNSSTTRPSGAGGGAYAKITNFVFTATGGDYYAIYQIGAGGAAVAINSGQVAGNAGGVTWFNTTSDPAGGSDNTKCSAKGGTGGTFVTAGTATGGAGGASASSWGQTKNDGGKGGDASADSGPGGGGAGGSTGPGGAGVNGATGSQATNGGAGGAGDSNGGTAGTAGTAGTGQSTLAGFGGNGSNLGLTAATVTATGNNNFIIGVNPVGTGGGGGGNWGSGSNQNPVAGDGGNYGGGGGACKQSASTGSATSGSGKQGLILVTYTPRRRISVET